MSDQVGVPHQPSPQWPVVAELLERALVTELGHEPAKASVSFLGVDPIEVLRFDRGDTIAYVSLGMARRPMTAAVESTVSDAGPRAELLVEVRGGEVWRALAVLAASPAVEGVVYVPGMTVDTTSALVAGSRCTGAVVIASRLGSIETTPGMAVEILQLLPATADELAWARVKGAAALQERWVEQHTELDDLGRASASLA